MRIHVVTVHLHRVLISATLMIASVLVIYAVSRAVDRPRFLANWLIAVDAGHGGHDKGAWYPNHRLIEKDINLDIAQNLSRLLTSDGASVILIREDDTFMRLGDRASKANNASARMFVSIHVNRYPASRSCHGAQVFYDEKLPASRSLADLVQAQLLGVDPLNCRRALPGDYRVLRDTVMPAILVEIGFATNSHDREMIMNPHYRRDVIYAIRNGILTYAQTTSSTPHDQIPDNNKAGEP
jgi:N-acetylmuramoyl-L-alanine amidase